MWIKTIIIIIIIITNARGTILYKTYTFTLTLQQMTVLSSTHRWTELSHATRGYSENSAQYNATKDSSLQGNQNLCTCVEGQENGFQLVQRLTLIVQVSVKQGAILKISYKLTRKIYQPACDALIFFLTVSNTNTNTVLVFVLKGFRLG